MPTETFPSSSPPLAPSLGRPYLIFNATSPSPRLRPQQGILEFQAAPVYSTLYCFPFPVTVLYYFRRTFLLSFNLVLLTLCSFMRPSLPCPYPFHPYLFPVFPPVLPRLRFVCLLTHTFDNFARPLVAYKVLWMYINCFGSTCKDRTESEG